MAKPRVVAVVQQKGGAGKTTLTINLAAAASSAGLKVLAVDMDRQGSLWDWFVAAAKVVAAPIDLIEVKRFERRLSVRELEALAVGADVVFLDCPGRGDAVTDSAAALSDLVLVPLQPGPLDFWATQETLAGLDRADAMLAELDLGPVRRACVINRAVRGSRLTIEAHAALVAAGVKLLGTVCQRVAFAETISRGKTVLDGGFSALLAAEDIRRVWRALERELYAESEESGRRRTPQGRKSGKTRRR